MNFFLYLSIDGSDSSSLIQIDSERRSLDAVDDKIVLELVGSDLARHDVVEQNSSEQVVVAEEGVQSGLGDLGEGKVGGGEDGEGAVAAQGLGQTGPDHEIDQSGKLCFGRDLGNGLAGYQARLKLIPD